MNGNEPPFYGKFRGVVTDNADLLMQGRIRAKVQDVYGDAESGWAMPTSPYAGSGVGLFLLPPVGASVWIEFEHGNPDYPIWSGCFWAEGEVPVTNAPPLLPYMKVLKTDQCTITLDDTPGIGGITIETSVGTGSKIAMNLDGVEITCSANKMSISLVSVSVNDGALEVI